MEKIKEFLDTDSGKIILAVCAGALFLFVFLAAAFPKTVNLYINSGRDNAYSFRSAKRITKGGSSGRKLA